MAYNCSPSFNWKKLLSDAEIATFQQRLGELGFKFQFITLAGFHALNHSMFTLASDYAHRGERFVDRFDGIKLHVRQHREPVGGC